MLLIALHRSCRLDNIPLLYYYLSAKNWDRMLKAIKDLVYTYIWKVLVTALVTSEICDCLLTDIYILQKVQ